MTDATPAFDATVPHSARVWSYWLGGKDHYPADRGLGERIRRDAPEIVEIARADRRFIIRSITHLAAREGVRQFLDVGTGLPTDDNTHEVAQAVARDAEVVYVDNDPMVLAHARALLTGTPEGGTHFIDADLLEPEELLGRARAYLDFTRPIALTFMSTLGHYPADERLYALIRTYVDALPSGSFLALNDSTHTSPQIVDSAVKWNQNSALPIHLRSPEQIEACFAGLELLDPGVVSLPFWRPDPARHEETREVAQYGGVGRKP
ncbi:SAM-dependent methyltransferase [Nocardiopsis sp. MG754419]|uniref:SAM-dependent methyltransferase n=1 Tax=Nocardiopsis sp. MG754419 TaxID=2259865 RepID=UPI001BACA948|nr:SAM-dependent methyltransferase [Nocardiopsis sp. MG754419]MBR8743000.1 SAM-dependent methyltransferase [Nocardiopsis sp. MG754419]